MSCFNNRSSSNILDSCCNGNELCQFSGNLDDVVSVPVYVQYVYDAVQFNMQGMKTVANQTFSPAIPCGFTVSRIADIRSGAYFNPANVDDCRNLTVDMNTTLSGASFLQDSQGNPITVIGPDGTYSQKILYADNSCCNEEGTGTPVFGTQNVSISGNAMVYIDLILCDNCNHEMKFTVCADVPIATRNQPMTLTNFFEVCMPSATNHAFLPRFTELTSCATEARLATNNCGRDLNINSNGELSGNLIIALCVSAEKKVVAPVQMCVLSTGMAEIPAQTNSICSGFPAMFASGITETASNDSCCCTLNFGRSSQTPGCGCDDNLYYRPENECCHPPHHNECGCVTDNSCSEDCGCSDHHMPRNCR